MLIEDILYLESILEAKSKDLDRQQGEELRKTTKECFKIRDRLLELQTQKYDLGSQQKIPDLQQHELEHLFDTIFNSPKLSTVTKTAINEVKNQNNSNTKIIIEV